MNIGSETSYPLTGWKCVICYQNAQCWCVDVCLCDKHAKEYYFGYGKSLVQMTEEFEEGFDHMSDCAVHNGSALPREKCNCGAMK